MVIRVCHMFTKLPDDAYVINVCSNSDPLWKQLSPFIAGPVIIAEGPHVKRMENAWQFTKVYKQHVGDDGNPTDEYFKWARHGFMDDRAHRYPMGKGAVPEYSWWKRERLGYIEARKRIYGPLYLRAIRETKALTQLRDLATLAGEDTIWLRDWDGRVTDETFTEVLNNPKRKAGHAFFLKAYIDNDPGLAELGESNGNSF